MLSRIKSLIRRRLPTLAFWIGQIRADLAQRARIVPPEADDRLNDRPRLLIDVTQTSNAKFLSGIQRVVLRLAQELLLAADRLSVEPVLVRLEGKGGELRLMRATELEARLGRTGPAAEQRIGICQRDILLMLDSSWIEYALFAKGVFPALKARGGKVVTCVYDLIPITHPQFCVRQLVLSFHRWVPIMLRSSDAIICISKATQDSFESYLESRRSRFGGQISYFHLGADFDRRTAAENKDDGDVPTVLMVGTLEPRKGYALAFAAFQRLWDRSHQIRLHIVGRFGWLVEQLVDEMKASPQFGRYLVVDFQLSDDALRAAYARADLVLSASFAEGFGLPLVEAAAFGKSLMVSDIPAYREVCGANAIYFASGDADDLVAKVERWLQERPSIPPPTFITWKDSARQLIERIEAIVE